MLGGQCRGPLRPWSEPEIPRARTKFVTDSIWRNVNKQLEAAREMEPRRTRLRCLIVVTTLADGSFVTSLSHTGILSAPSRLNSYLNAVIC